MRVGLLALILSAAAAAQQRPDSPVLPLPLPPGLQPYKLVTADRLKQPEDGDWLMIRRTYNGWGYSPLDQITTSNVAGLQPAWVFATGVTNGHEAPPIVNNGDHVRRHPGQSGARARRAQRRSPLALPPAAAGRRHPPARRPAAAWRCSATRCSSPPGDAVLVALDAKTGKEVWTTKVADNKAGYYMSVAPLVAERKVLVGASGGELGVRGFVAAFDVENGKELWKTHTVPAPGEPGSETWPKGGDQWKTGGGSVWVTGNYDPETNLAFWGTGNGGPWMGDQRPGDNLYTSSTIAIDVATGKIKGHFQYDPNESWDWDEVSPPILVDYTRNGRTIKGLIDVARDGYLWFLERSDGPIRFVEGKPYVKQNVFKSLDPKTGRPEVDAARQPGTGKEAQFCPSHWGGKNWPPIAFSPKTRMIYIPANENLCATMTGRPVTYTAGRVFTGATSSIARSNRAPITSAKCRRGTWTPASACGRRRSRHRRTGVRCSRPAAGSSSAAAPTIVCSARSMRRRRNRLWEFPTNSGIIGQPSSFTVDGKQYIAVQSGWGIDARGMQSALSRQRAMPDVPEGGAVWVFAVK